MLILTATLSDTLSSGAFTDVTNAQSAEVEQAIRHTTLATVETAPGVRLIALADGRTMFTIDAQHGDRITSDTALHEAVIDRAIDTGLKALLDA